MVDQLTGQPVDLSTSSQLVNQLTKQLLEKDRREVNLTEWLEGPGKEEKYVMLGGATAYVRGKNYKVVDTSIWPYSTGELARPYLKACLEAAGRQRLWWRKKDALEGFTARSPRWFVGGTTKGELSHIDITAAYWQIWERVGLDIIYRPGIGISRGQVDLIEPQALWPYKALRTTAAGLIRSQGAQAMRLGQRVEVRPPPDLLAPNLWWITMDTLRCIALEAVERFECLHWATDGGVFRAEQGEAFSRELDEVWGLAHTVETDLSGHLWGWNRLRIGRKTTRLPQEVTGPVDSISEDRMARVARLLLRKTVEPN